jgi:hypothetical protein
VGIIKSAGVDNDPNTFTNLQIKPSMGPLDLLNHLLNFFAPAMGVALLVTLAARVFMKKRPVAPALYAQAAINFVVCAAALMLGLWFFGHDGKMATYSGLVLVCTSSQWFIVRGWRA